MPSTETNTVTAEGYNLAEALATAAEELGIDASLVQHKYDRDHFRGPNGTMRAVDTVKIIAWAPNLDAMQGGLYAESWVRTLVGHMGFEAKVKLDVRNENEAAIKIDSPNGRHLVGRRGTTIKAIQTVLNHTMSLTFPDWTVRIDVLGGSDDRERRRDDDDRPRRSRDRDRDGDRGRGRDRDRGRGRDRDRDRDGDRGRGRDRDRDRRSDSDVKRLKKLASRLAEKALESGEAIIVKKDLNSYERRVVHMEIAEIDGVETASVWDGDVKKVRIQPVGFAGEE